MSKSVAVCVKKGNSKLSKETLQWLEKEIEIPEVCIYLLQFNMLFLQCSKLTSFCVCLRNYKESLPPLWVRKMHMIRFWWTSLSTSCWRTLTCSSTRSTWKGPPFSYSKYEALLVFWTESTTNCTNYKQTNWLICVLPPVGKRIPVLMGIIDCGFSAVTVLWICLMIS